MMSDGVISAQARQRIIEKPTDRQCIISDMPNNTVYLVCGVTGMYDSVSEWNVAAYLDKAEANRHCDELTRFAEEALASKPGQSSCRKVECYLDPKMEIIDDKLGYFIAEVPLRTAMPQDCWTNPSPEKIQAALIRHCKTSYEQNQALFGCLADPKPTPQQLRDAVLAYCLHTAEQLAELEKTIGKVP